MNVAILPSGTPLAFLPPEASAFDAKPTPRVRTTGDNHVGLRPTSERDCRSEDRAPGFQANDNPRGEGEDTQGCTIRADVGPGARCHRFSSEGTHERLVVAVESDRRGTHPTTVTHPVLRQGTTSAQPAEGDYALSCASHIRDRYNDGDGEHLRHQGNHGTRFHSNAHQVSASRTRRDGGRDQCAERPKRREKRP